jgi:2-polyprenyl-3-methyl-5-hydroxy-6-metoxy-1,4-benzoquinol methylase
MGLASRALELDPVVGQCIERAGVTPQDSVPGADLFNQEEIAALVNNPLLILVLESTPVTNRGIERFITCARATLLDRLERPEPIRDDLLAFYASLAIQCFITEYVFSVTEWELASAQAARERLIAALASGAEAAPILLIAVAAYFPLATLPGCEKMLTRNWPAAITRLLDQQVREPLQEREVESCIPRLTPIEDRISRLVQKQYDENPYPRWIKTVETGGRPKQIDEYLQAMFPLAPVDRLGKNKLDILIAGAGTGRQAIEVARQFSRSRVLAVDLSRTALAYAKRKSDELGINNIEYGHADILKIDTLKRRFDVIYAAGVLHHLADPFAGWRQLHSILGPKGFMNIGLYSARAREDIVAAQRFLAEKGYKATSDDVRRCRNEFERLPTESPLRRVMSFADFYSLSELRDLLFHVQEQRTNLPQIARFLIDNKLQFLGFKQATRVLQRYRQLFPQDGPMTDLALWDRFEVQNPRTFVTMYQFWVQKTGENSEAAGAGC